MKPYIQNILFLSLVTNYASMLFTQEENQLCSTKSLDTVALIEQINNLGTANDASGLNVLPLITQAAFIGNLGLNSAITTEFSGTNGTGTSVATINNDLYLVTIYTYTFLTNFYTYIANPTSAHLSALHGVISVFLTMCQNAIYDLANYNGTRSSTYSPNTIIYTLYSAKTAANALLSHPFN